MIDRRRFLEACSVLGLSGTLFPGTLYAEVARGAGQGRHTAEIDVTITADHVEAAAVLAGLSFSAEEREMMAEDLNDHLDDYQAMREVGLSNADVPAVTFDPRLGGASIPEVASGESGSMTWTPPPADRPARDEDLAYAGVAELASLLRTGQVTSVELTELYLGRLRRYDDTLKAVITYTEERAMESARAADAEIEAGNWRGPLHGVPYGAKDLLAVEGYKTTWGAKPYEDQTIDETAAVVDHLDEAGAVLVAKLSLGALAWGDVWYGGTTKNPWNVEQGSSGSSAGPGSAVAAGCVPFAIGSETLGSIVSPSTRNGVTGLRPSFGAVSRHGAMTLSWTMDKLGPMARSALDCALVFDAIRGADPRDPASTDVPFPYDPDAGIDGLRVGYLASAFESDYSGAASDRETLDVLRSMGVDLQPVEWPESPPAGAILHTLEVEAAAAFDELTRTGGVDAMVRQERDAWPHVFRTARCVPAVEFMQMNRHRAHLMKKVHAVMEPFDVVVTPTYQGGTLSITNLTGHPCVCVPNAFTPVEDAPENSPRRSPSSITFIGDLYRDEAAVALAHAYQQETSFHRRRPPIR